MRKPILIGNWKMNKTRDEALQYVYAVNEELISNANVDVVICAPAIVLRDLVKRADFKIGAQNMHYAESGAFTGEISPSMLASTGVKYVIVGHSERRQMFNETNESVNKKMRAAFSANLTPILCVGETLAEQEAGLKEQVLKFQIISALIGVSKEDLLNSIIAYEPVWAIGTGKTASTELADKTCGFIRHEIESLFDAEAANNIRIIYGGSATTQNIGDLIKQENIDGALVGGSSLSPASFVEMASIISSTIKKA